MFNRGSKIKNKIFLIALLCFWHKGDLFLGHNISKTLENMPYQFSEELRIKAKKVFEEKAGYSLTMDQVDLWLDRLGQLGMLFVKNVEEGRIKIDDLPEN